MPAAAPAMPPKPRAPAIRAMTARMMAHFNMMVSSNIPPARRELR